MLEARRRRGPIVCHPTSITSAPAATLNPVVSCISSVVHHGEPAIRARARARCSVILMSVKNNLVGNGEVAMSRSRRPVHRLSTDCPQTVHRPSARARAVSTLSTPTANTDECRLALHAAGGGKKKEGGAAFSAGFEWNS